jgi:hypothetical protein
VNNGSYAAGNSTTSLDGNGGIVLTFAPNVTPPVTHPLIMSITRGGAGTMTLNYTNTLPGTNYVLSYTTNLSATNWSTSGTKTAAGTSDSQTDSSATDHHRFYRVYYP